MSRKPNILLFLPDGMQADVLGNPACRTPNFDRVMRRGTQFSRAYTPSQVCSPARASLAKAPARAAVAASEARPMTTEWSVDWASGMSRLSIGSQTGHNVGAYDSRSPSC